MFFCKKRKGVRRRIKKYNCAKSALALMIICDIVLLIVYVALFVISQNSGLTPEYKATIDVFLNIFLILFSVLTTSLISIPAIEARSKNLLCEELLSGDLLQSPSFYALMTQDQKKGMLSLLKSVSRFEDNPAKISMYQSITEKIDSNSDDLNSQIYLGTCSIDIQCAFVNGKIEKTILKTIDIFSYEPQVHSGYVLLRQAVRKGKTGAESSSNIVSLRVNDKLYDKPSDIVKIEESSIDSSLVNKSGNTHQITHTYQGNIKLSPDKACRIVLEYKTYVDEDDIVYSYRMSMPCQKFSLNFQLVGEAANTHMLDVSAFGFVDDAHNSPNRTSDMSKVSVSFDSWIFPHDGVAITIKPRSNH